MSNRFYPRIAVAKKDMKIEVYAHKNEEFYKPSSEESSVFEDLFRETNNSGYVLFKEYAVPKETVRSVLWAPRTP